MPASPSGADCSEVAREILATLDARRQIQPLSLRPGGFGLDAAYGVTAALRDLREARGERPVGRKIGFTNRTIWDEYGVHAPIWGYMYDTTLRDADGHAAELPASRLVEPRIEPEICFGLARAPEPGMDEAALLACVEWIAHGVELVQSLFPGWRFAAADTVAALGLHGAYVVGPRRRVRDEARADWLEALTRFSIELSCDGRPVDTGRAANVLGGPLSALRHLVGLLDADARHPPLAAGEIVTTGTVTRAFPVEPGQTWATRLTGIALEGLTLRMG
jgi:2-oxo-3-hexenedioate decarboxylase